jgi:hypothetical protein
LTSDPAIRTYIYIERERKRESSDLKRKKGETLLLTHKQEKRLDIDFAPDEGFGNSYLER